MNTFQLVQNYGGYVDFERTLATFPDEGQTDIVERVSFEIEDRECWVTILRTNEDGNTRELSVNGEGGADIKLTWEQGLARIAPLTLPTDEGAT
jgi:hypothetical protein